MTNLSYTATCVNGADGPAVSPVGHNLPDPRGSLPSAIPAKFSKQLVYTCKCRKKLKAWLEVSAVLTSSNGPTLPSEIGKYAHQHGAAAAARSF